MSLSDRQAAASRQGAEFEAMCETWLKIHGHRIVERHWVHSIVGVEIDRVTMHAEFGEVWVECKGSWESPSANGLERTDTLLKAIANGYLLRYAQDHHSYWLMCSHLPRPGSRGELWLSAASSLFDRVVTL
jgi:hypothetical protein